MKGKYYLEEIDGILYSTNSYEIYNLYNKLFFEEVKEEHLPVDNPFESIAEANRETFLKALEQEKRIYECGFVPELVTVRGKYKKTWKKTVWVRNEVKALEMLNKINNYDRKATK